MWELDDGRVLQLYTIEQLRALPDGTVVIDIFGKAQVTPGLDEDTRGGYVAFGRLLWYVVDGKVYK